MLAIKPAKVERIYPDPEFLLFRGAVHDYEIDRIKQLANPIVSIFWSCNVIDHSLLQLKMIGRNIGFATA